MLAGRQKERNDRQEGGGGALLQVLRTIDSLQLTEKFSVATPVNWRHGDACMVVPTLSDEAAMEAVGFPCACLLRSCSSRQP